MMLYFLSEGDDPRKERERSAFLRASSCGLVDRS
jgi:hypothetical protein